MPLPNGHSGVAGDRLSIRYVTHDPAFAGDARIRTNAEMITDGDLPTDKNIVANRGTARDACLTREDAIFADVNVVRDGP
jgi:hypothetical protein